MRRKPGARIGLVGSNVLARWGKVLEADRSTDEYWDNIVTEWRREGTDWLWRAFSDRQQSEWAKQYLFSKSNGPKFVRLLKTDLFDEAVSDGIVPVLARGAEEVWGVDVSADVVDAAVTRYPQLRVCVASVSRLPYESCFFQAIFSGSTLDHYDSKGEIIDAIRELYRVLDRDGQLFLTLDNPQQPMVWLRNGILRSVGTSLGWIPYHVGKTLGRRELVSVMREVGFQIISVDALQHCPRWWAIRKLRRLAQGEPEKYVRYMNHLARYEKLGRLPSRFFTGYYVCVLATKA